jgi:AcrR family transcriptional regulator
MSRRSGRRAGAPDTRAEILTAAKSVFAEAGYDRATIRGIAAEAGVDPSLVHHYFGSKDRLFAASIDIPLPPIEAVSKAFSEGNAAGHLLATIFFSVWEQHGPRDSLLGMLRSAMGGEDQAVEAFREFVTRELLHRIAPQIPGEDGSLRALVMVSQLVGIAITRYVVKLEPIASAPIEDIIALVAPRIQSYLDDRALPAR